MDHRLRAGFGNANLLDLGKPLAHHIGMKRVMIIGQPGAGKSTLARAMGDITHLPVVHIDHIHWQSGWRERSRPEKDRLCHQVHVGEAWIFEGGHSATWTERLARADTLIWLDLPVGLRLWRVLWRTARHFGQARPDLPAGCHEQFSAEFIGYIWRTRASARQRMRALYDSAPEGKARHRLTGKRDVARYLADLRRAVSVGNLDIPHR